MLYCVCPGSKGAIGRVVRQQGVPERTLHIALRLTEVGACAPSVGRAPDCILQSLCIATRRICPLSRLPGRPMKGSTDIAWGVLRDMAVAAKLGAQLLELHIVLGELASEWLEEVEEVLRVDATSAQ